MVILDPWLEPLPIPGPAPFTAAPPSSAGTTLEEDINSSIYSAASNVVKDIETKPHPRILVINSETFTIWKDHYARLQEVVAQWEPNGGQILTISKTFSLCNVLSQANFSVQLDRYTYLFQTSRFSHLFVRERLVTYWKL